MSTPLVRTFTVAFVAILALSGCATTTDAAPAPSASASENPYGGFPVDPPAADEVVLTVVGTTSIDYTYAELEEMATQQFEIMEPFVNQDQSFSGVPLAELFAASGIAPGDTVDTIALNDYHYSDAAEKFEGANGILAVLRDGEPIPMDAGGPIRIVFPSDSSYFDFVDAWNWSIRSIVVVTD